MAFGEGQAPKLPPVYCVGVVKSVENLRASKKAAEGSPYYVIDVKLEPLFAPQKQDYTFYLSFDPDWLRADVEEEITSQRMFRQVVGEKGKTSALQGLLNSHFDEFVGEVNEAGSATAEELFTYLQENAQGETVGFVLTQQTDAEEVEDEDGETVKQYFRTDRYQVGRFFLPDQVERLDKALVKARAKKQEPNFKIMWEEGSNPFGA